MIKIMAHGCEHKKHTQILTHNCIFHSVSALLGKPFYNC